MIKATFVGDSERVSYQTDDFIANVHNKVTMKDSTWKTVENKGDDILFTDVEKVDAEFPEITQVMPGK